jgi:glycosyltransferase 2 family protein
MRYLRPAMSGHARRLQSPSGTGGRRNEYPVLQPPQIQVSDQLERRIRKPIDALRCVVTCIFIIAAIVASIAAGATTAGAQVDIVGASKRLPQALLIVVPQIARLGLLILPLALAVTQIVRRQVRRLIEAAVTGLGAGLVTGVANMLLERQAAARLYYAIIMAQPGTSHVDALDPYLVGLVAFVTMIGLTGRPGWRNALTLAIGVYVIVQLAASNTTHVSVLTILITLLAGHAIGLAVRYAAGSASQRPSARDIAVVLSHQRVGRARHDRDLTVAAIRRVPQPRTGAPGSRHYVVTTLDGRQLDAVVFDRDQQAAGTFYQLYRWIRVPGQVSRTAPLSLDRAVERRALLTYAAEDAGVPTPRLRTLVRVGPDAAVLAYDHHEWTSLAERNHGCTDEELGRVWDAVTRLHAHHVAHRGLTADRIVFTPVGRVMLLDPGDGDVAASDLQLRLDLAQLIAELALVVGPEKSARLAVERVGRSELMAVLPLLQPVALVRSTRHELRRRRDVLPAVRKVLLSAVPDGEVVPVQLERIRPRALVTMVASVFAVYLLAGELAKASLGSALRAADWRWGIVALGLSVATYVGASLSVSGFVSEKLGFVRTVLVQLASSFVTLVTPAAVGGVALNVRYLQRRKIPAPAAVASIAVSQVVALALHVSLLVVFAAITGAGDKSPIHPPTWSYFVVAGLVAVACGVLAFPAGRRLVRARLSPTFGQVLPRLVEIAQRPAKLAEGIGGTVLLCVAYIFCLVASVAAFGGPVSIAKIGFVYLTGAALGSIIPTPGGLGAVEAALTAGLIAAGVPSGVAVSSVLLFRLLTFWLPVPLGWVALNYLERQHDL